MKKTFLSFALLVAIAATASAQLYVGGGIGISSQSGTTTSSETKVNGVVSTPVAPEVKGTSDFTFTFTPEVGYSINDKMGVGVAFSYRSTTNDDQETVVNQAANPLAIQTGDNINTVVKKTGWAFSPYFQYYVAKFGKLNLSFIATPSFSGSTETTTDNSLDISPNVPAVAKSVVAYTPTEVKNSAFAFSVVPVIDYKLTEKILLFANINLLSLNYASNTKTTTSTSISYTGVSPNAIPSTTEQVDKEKYSNFSFGASTYNMFTSGSITVGALIYF